MARGRPSLGVGRRPIHLLCTFFIGCILREPTARTGQTKGAQDAVFCKVVRFSESWNVSNMYANLVLRDAFFLVAGARNYDARYECDGNRRFSVYCLYLLVAITYQQPGHTLPSSQAARNRSEAFCAPHFWPSHCWGSGIVGRLSLHAKNCRMCNVWTGMQQRKRQLPQWLYLLVGNQNMCETRLAARNRDAERRVQ